MKNRSVVKRKRKAIVLFCIILFSCLLIQGCKPSLNPVDPETVGSGINDPLILPSSETLMILQIGAATDGAVSHSFVELYNNSNHSINLEGYSLQYAAGTKAVDNLAVDGEWKRINLSGSVDVHHSFLILGAKGTGTAPELAIKNNSGDINEPAMVLSNRAVKVVLLSNQTQLTSEAQNPFNTGSGSPVDSYIDMIGVTNDDTDQILGYEGGEEDTPKGAAPFRITKQMTVRRKTLTDTDVNSVDFAMVDWREIKSPDETELYRPKNHAYDSWNPYPYNSGTFNMSHPKSGVYSQGFNLVLTAPSGSSIYYTRDGSIPSPGKAGTVKYSAPIPILSSNLNGQNNANILSSENNTLQMYVKKDDWFWRDEVEDLVYYAPTAARVPKAAVIRVLTMDPAGKKNDVVTRTYFIGGLPAAYASYPIVSLVSGPDNLVSESRGILVRGGVSKEWVESVTGTPELAYTAYNFQQKGSEWERDAYMEIFNGIGSSRSIGLATGVGIRVRGGYSRAMAQKSLSVYFRAEYGLNNLKNYTLIPGAVKADLKTPLTQFKNFAIRNGGDDTEMTKLHDVFAQSLVSDRSFSTNAQYPCILYLNGEYWGPYNLCEKHSSNSTEYKYGVNKDNVISVENSAIDDGLETDISYWNTMIAAGTKDMTVQANYDDFCEIMDIDNMIDYFAAEIYLYNYDWPNSNYRLWRTCEPEPGNPYADTKWRWQAFDFDATMGIHNTPTGNTDHPVHGDTFNYLLNTGNGAVGNSRNNRMFKALLTNRDFCIQFINTMLDLYNVNFRYENWKPILDKYVNMYRPLMYGSSGTPNSPGAPSYFTRWGYPYNYNDGGWNTVFPDNVNGMDWYMSHIGEAMVKNYLPKYFSGYSNSVPDVGSYYIANIGIKASDLHSVTIATQGTNSGKIKINTTPELPSGWTGQYYGGIPIPIEAIAPNGYVFSSWTVTGGSVANATQKKTTVTISGNATIRANFISE